MGNDIRLRLEHEAQQDCGGSAEISDVVRSSKPFCRSNSSLFTMLFNSVSFIFIFMPIVLFVFFATARLLGQICSAFLLVTASLFFYAWDDPWRLLPLILGSMVYNFGVAQVLMRRASRLVLACGIVGDVAVLGYFKYSGLLANSFNALSPLPIPEPQVVLPIGISFYTFTQIAFLVDTYRGQVKRCSILYYANFVTLFPHLIAGPILHHVETIPQLEDRDIYRFDLPNFTYGLSYFIAGLFKKVVLADTVGVYANVFFNTKPPATGLSGADAWIGALSYAFQLYFDFSGYSDMAIGLALMLNVRFPVNFDSPYKAVSMINFWRRWHITLSAFLRDYLYIPLGGSRCGTTRRYANLMATMVLGGLWHGALWNFAIWGGIHGFGLMINHLWRNTLGRRLGVPALVGWGLTFVLVVLAWVPFRAESLTQSAAIWSAMVDPRHLVIPANVALTPALPLLAVLAGIAFVLPNTQTLFGYSLQPQTRRTLVWKMSLHWAIGLGCAFGLALAGMIEKPTTFLYFRF